METILSAPLSAPFGGAVVWPDGRKSPYQATAIKNTEERQKISEAAITKWMLVLDIF